MNQNNSPAHNRKNTTDHLANERTFLAWIRTAIAMMGFGFVIVKFAVFLKQFALIADKHDPYMTVTTTRSAIVGITMVAFGAFITLFGYIRYVNIRQKIDANAYYPTRWLSLAVTVGIVIVGILMVVYLLPNIWYKALYVSFLNYFYHDYKILFKPLVFVFSSKLPT